MQQERQEPMMGESPDVNHITKVDENSHHHYVRKYKERLGIHVHATNRMVASCFFIPARGLSVCLSGLEGSISELSTWSKDALATMMITRKLLAIARGIKIWAGHVCLGKLENIST